MERRDLVIAPLCEGALVLVVALAAWVARQPLIFASLGPTAFELIETPKRSSARPYNVIVGHLIAVISAYIALYVTRGWWAPAASLGDIRLARVACATLAGLLTVLGTLLLRATQPAALSTTLLIALGVMQRKRDALIIMAGVLLMVAVGEPLRRWRARTMQDGS